MEIKGDRASVLFTYLVAAGLLAGCTPAANPQPESTPSPLISPTPEHHIIPPTLTPTANPETIHESVVREMQRQVFDTSIYHKEAQETIKNLLVNGKGQTLEYRLDGRIYYLYFLEPAKSDIKLEVTLDNKPFIDGTTGPAFLIQGGSFGSILAELPKDIQNQLKDKNFSSQSIGCITSVNAFIAIGKTIGLNFNNLLQRPKDDEDKMSKIEKYLDEIILTGRAVFIINEYLLTLPLMAKDPITGEPIWEKLPSGEYVPILRINNYPDFFFNDTGNSYFVHQTIGRALIGISNWEDLNRKYTSLLTIPGFDQYLGHFKGNHIRGITA